MADLSPVTNKTSRRGIDEADAPSVVLPRVDKAQAKAREEAPVENGKIGVVFPPEVPREVKDQFLQITNTVLGLLRQFDPALGKALSGADLQIMPVPDIKQAAKDFLANLPAGAPAEIRSYLQGIIDGKIKTDSFYVAMKDGETGKVLHSIVIDKSAYESGLTQVLSTLGNELQHLRLVVNNERFATPVAREIRAFELSLAVMEKFQKLLRENAIASPESPELKKMLKAVGAIIADDQARLASWKKAAEQGQTP